MQVTLGHTPSQNTWANENGGGHPEDKQGAASRSGSELWVGGSNQRMRGLMLLHLTIECLESSGDRQASSQGHPFSQSAFSSLSSQDAGFSWLSAFFSGQASLLPRLLFPSLFLEGRHRQAVAWVLPLIHCQINSTHSVHTASSSTASTDSPLPVRSVPS